MSGSEGRFPKSLIEFQRRFATGASENPRRTLQRVTNWLAHADWLVCGDCGMSPCSTATAGVYRNRAPALAELRALRPQKPGHAGHPYARDGQQSGLDHPVFAMAKRWPSLADAENSSAFISTSMQ